MARRVVSMGTEKGVRAPWAIVGCGAVGSALAVALWRADGRPQLLWSRHAARARSLRARLLREGARSDRVQATTRLERLVSEARGVLIAVQDDAVGRVAACLAKSAVGPSGSRRARGPVWHTSGIHGPEVLAPLAESGWQAGKLHPLCAVPPRGRASSGALAGAWFVVAGSPAAVRAGRTLVRSIGGELLELRGVRAQERYHAAASLLAGGGVALFDVALQLLSGSVQGGADRASAALIGLWQSALDNVAELGPRDALTGAIARGSDTVARAHVKELGTLGKDEAELYRLLGRRMLALARARKSVSPAEARRLEAALR